MCSLNIFNCYSNISQLSKLQLRNSKYLYFANTNINVNATIPVLSETNIIHIVNAIRTNRRHALAFFSFPPLLWSLLESLEAFASMGKQRGQLGQAGCLCPVPPHIKYHCWPSPSSQTDSMMTSMRLTATWLLSVYTGIKISARLVMATVVVAGPTPSFQHQCMARFLSLMATLEHQTWCFLVVESPVLTPSDAYWAVALSRWPAVGELSLTSAFWLPLRYSPPASANN